MFFDLKNSKGIALNADSIISLSEASTKTLEITRVLSERINALERRIDELENECRYRQHLLDNLRGKE